MEECETEIEKQRLRKTREECKEKSPMIQKFSICKNQCSGENFDEKQVQILRKLMCVCPLN